MPRTRSARWPTLELYAALLICFAYIFWMLSLPCFPSADGPVHMYYVHIFGTLLSHSNPVYPHFFRIRHILPPYSLYYYALLALSSFVPMLLADRIIICAYFISFVLGFRYLARAIGPSADRMTLLAVLLLLNWPLGMGFVNFCLALSFAMWATGVWLRLQGTVNLSGRIVFLMLVSATMLTHPVPLLLLLAVVGIILAARFLDASRLAGRFTTPTAGKTDLLTYAIAALNLAYVKVFTKANPLHQSADVAPPSYTAEFVRRFKEYFLREHALGFVYGSHHPDLLVYRIALILTLIVPVALAVGQWRRNRGARLSSTGDVFLLIGVAAFVLLPALPSQLNGSYYFADRLVLCVWLAFLLAAAGWTGKRDSTGSGWPWIVCALVANLCLLTSANRLLRPAARAVATLEGTSLTPPGQVGFVLEDPRPPAPAAEEVSWSPYTWALANIFRHNDAVMANPPWMDVTIIPIEPTPALPEVPIPALQQPIMVSLQPGLLAAPADLKSSLAATDFFIVNTAGRPSRGPEPLLQAAGPAAKGWSCSDQLWYRICSRSPVQFRP